MRVCEIYEILHRHREKEREIALTPITRGRGQSKEYEVDKGARERFSFHCESNDISASEFFLILLEKFRVLSQGSNVESWKGAINDNFFVISTLIKFNIKSISILKNMSTVKLKNS